MHPVWTAVGLSRLRLHYITEALGAQLARDHEALAHVATAASDVLSLLAPSEIRAVLYVRRGDQGGCAARVSLGGRMLVARHTVLGGEAPAAVIERPKRSAAYTLAPPVRPWDMTRRTGVRAK
jgi:hypothetical protein